MELGISQLAVSVFYRNKVVVIASLPLDQARVDLHLLQLGIGNYGNITHLIASSRDSHLSPSTPGHHAGPKCNSGEFLRQ